MLRDLNLVPLSRQHHSALALCVRLERGLKSATLDLEQAQQEIERIARDEIHYHFEAEERFVFPIARALQSLTPLVDELLEEHARLRDYQQRAQARQLGATELRAFSGLLSGHIRKEERQLFEECQRLLPSELLHHMGREIESFFRESDMPSEVCALTLKGLGHGAR